MANDGIKPRWTLPDQFQSDESRAILAEAEKKAAAEEKQKRNDALARQFVPRSVSRKNNNNKTAQKPRKPTSANMPKPSANTVTPPAASSPETAIQQPPSAPQAQPQRPQVTQKRGFNDWLAKEGEEELYPGPRNYPSKKKIKKTKAQRQPISFDDPYDPAKPVPFEQYQGSDDYQRMQAGFNQSLYAAKDQTRAQRGGPVQDDRSYPFTGNRQAPFNQIPPPPSGFAPPSNYDSGPSSRQGSLGPSSGRNSSLGAVDYAGPPPPPAELDIDESGDDVYARRAAMAMQPQLPTGPANRGPTPNAPFPNSSAPAAHTSPPANMDEQRAKVKAQLAAMKAKIAARANASPGVPAQNSAGGPSSASTSPPASTTPPPARRPSWVTVSAAATVDPEKLKAHKAQQEEREYDNLQAELREIPGSMEVGAPAAPRSHAPGQAGFAERHMARMGYQKGSGLGANGEGMTSALQVKADKRKKKSDAEGGGYVTPANTGKIIGGKNAKKSANDDKNSHGKMSAVVKFENMLSGMDVDKAIQEEDLMQEIGDEMADFGKVERLKVWRFHEGGNDEVFIKFTSQLSALRAIKDMDGAEFANNVIKASYWDEEKFEAGEYA